MGAPVLTIGATLDNPQRLRAGAFAGFAQDSWRVAPDLTLRAGIRFELFTPAVDRDDRANLYDAPAGRLVRVGTAGMPRGGDETDRDNIAPRVGLTWAPGGGRTLVRGGYGMYYSQSTLAPSEALYFSPPYFNARFYFPLPGLPLSLSDPFPSFFPLPSPPSALSIQPDLATPVLHHWNAGVEHRVGFWTMTAAYAGSRGAHLLASRDINQPAPSANPLNFRPNPASSDSTQLESRALALSRAGHQRRASIPRRCLAPRLVHPLVVKGRRVGIFLERWRSELPAGQPPSGSGVRPLELRCATPLVGWLCLRVALSPRRFRVAT